MNNLFISMMSPYTQMHGTMNYDFMHELCLKSGWKGLVFVAGRDDMVDPPITDDVLTLVDLPNGRVSDLNCLPYDQKLQDFMTEVRSRYGKIDNVFFFQDWHMQRYLKPFIEGAKVHYFVRLLINNMLDSNEKCLQRHPHKKEEVDEQKEYWKYVKDVELKRIDEAEKVICASSTVIDFLMDRYGVDEKFVVIGSYSDKIPQLPDLTSHNDYSLKQLVAPGRNDLQKGIWRLGDSHHFEVFVERDNLKLWGNRTALGNVLKEDSRPWYERFKEIPFVLFPAIYETRGLLVQEAMACGKIVFVAKDSPALCEQVEHGVNGFIVDFDTDWEQQISDIINTNNLNNVAATAREQILRLFKENNFRDKLKDYLRGLL